MSPIWEFQFCTAVYVCVYASTQSTHHVCTCTARSRTYTCTYIVAEHRQASMNPEVVTTIAKLPYKCRTTYIDVTLICLAPGQVRHVCGYTCTLYSYTYLPPQLASFVCRVQIWCLCAKVGIRACVHTPLCTCMCTVYLLLSMYMYTALNRLRLIPTYPALYPALSLSISYSSPYLTCSVSDQCRGADLQRRKW